MRSFIQNSAINFFSLFVVPYIFSGFIVHGGLPTLILAGAVLTVMSFTIKPILTIVTLPLNIVTFGAFSFLINAIIFYLLTIFVPQISITAFTFPGLSFAGFITPSIHFNTFFAFIVISLGFSFIVSVLKWILQK